MISFLAFALAFALAFTLGLFAFTFAFPMPGLANGSGMFEGTRTASGAAAMLGELPADSLV